MTAVVRARARVRGRVQGVFFRALTVDEAERLGLSGWVRNLAGGDVELEAQGERAVVEALIAWARQGPPSARVSGVDVEWMAAVAGEQGFAVRR